MEDDFNSVQRAALLALRGGVLLHGEHGWLVDNDQESRSLPEPVVRWLFGEGFLGRAGAESAGRTAYTLTGKGLRAAERSEATEARLSLESAPLAALSGAPLLLLAPADSSEELDYLLCVPLGPAEVELHRRRRRAVAPLSAGDPARFEFVQYRDDLHALPITQRLARLGLLPAAGRNHLLLEAGLPAEELDLRRCTDRGVNYGAGWVQWFGGFDRESPLIVTPRLDLAEFEAILAGLPAA